MSDIKPRVSIIIPHWNNIDILSECLESITLTSYINVETIVVDNASTDDSVEWVRSNYPKVKLIENDKNYGYAGGCNIGAEYASGEYLIFLNNDTTQDPNWVSNLVDTISSNSKIAAVQPKVLNFFDKNLFDYAGGSGGHMDIYCFPIARGRVFQHQEHDKGQYNDVDKCFWSSGTCFIVKKIYSFKLICLMIHFSRTWKRLIFVGNCNLWVMRFGLILMLWYIIKMH